MGGGGEKSLSLILPALPPLLLISRAGLVMKPTELLASRGKWEGTNHLLRVNGKRIEATVACLMVQHLLRGEGKAAATATAGTELG